MSEGVTLPPKWRIVIEGDTKQYQQCWRSASIKDYLLNRLFQGGEIAADSLDAWGFRIVDVSEAPEPNP